MPFYTIIMEFAGGSYASQVKAPSPKLACVKWAQDLPANEISGLGQKSKVALVEKMKEKSPVPIKRSINVWCTTAVIRGKLALLNIIQTEDAKS